MRRLVEQPPGRRRPMVRRVLQIAHRLHLQHHPTATSSPSSARWKAAPPPTTTPSWSTRSPRPTKNTAATATTSPTTKRSSPPTTSSSTNGASAKPSPPPSSSSAPSAKSATTPGRTTSRTPASPTTLDFAAISGWESTAIENHSGIVDNLRNFKSDPTPHQRHAPTHPPLRQAAQRSASHAANPPPSTSSSSTTRTQPATGTLTFSMITPSNKRIKLEDTSRTQQPNARSVQLSARKKPSHTPPLTEEGLYRFKFSLSSAPLSTQTKEIWVTDSLIPTATRRRNSALQTIAVSGITPALQQTTRRRSVHASASKSTTSSPAKTTTSSSPPASPRTPTPTHNVGETTGLEATPPMKPGHTPEPGEEAQIIATRPPQHRHPRSRPRRHATPRHPAGRHPLRRRRQTTRRRRSLHLQRHRRRLPRSLDGQLVLRPRAPTLRRPARQPGHGQLLPDQRPPVQRPPHRQTPNGARIEIIAAYSRDHDRNIGAGTFTTRSARPKSSTTAAPTSTPSSSNASSPTPSAGSPPEHARLTQRDTMKL